MKNHRYVRAALVVTSLAAAQVACKDTEAERKAAEAAKQAQEAETTAAKMRAESDQAVEKLKVTHTDARTKLQRDLDTHERKATYLKEKAAKLTGDKKKNADAAVTELTSRQTTAKASLARLANDADPAWDATKKTVEDDIAAVGKAVDSLEQAVEKK